MREVKIHGRGLLYLLIERSSQKHTPTPASTAQNAHAFYTHKTNKIRKEYVGFTSSSLRFLLGLGDLNENLIRKSCTSTDEHHHQARHVFEQNILKPVLSKASFRNSKWRHIQVIPCLCANILPKHSNTPGGQTARSRVPVRCSLLCSNDHLTPLFFFSSPEFGSFL